MPVCPVYLTGVGTSSGGALAMDGTLKFYARVSDGAIVSEPWTYNSSSITVLYTPASGRVVSYPVLDNTGYLYWAETIVSPAPSGAGDAVYIKKMAKTGGTVTTIVTFTLASTPSNFTQVQVTNTLVWNPIDGNLYMLWLGTKSGPVYTNRLYRCSTSGGSLTVMLTDPTLFASGAMTATSDGAVWGSYRRAFPDLDYRRVWRLPLGGSIAYTADIYVDRFDSDPDGIAPLANETAVMFNYNLGFVSSPPCEIRRINSDMSIVSMGCASVNYPNGLYRLRGSIWWLPNWSRVGFVGDGGDPGFASTNYYEFAATVGRTWGVGHEYVRFGSPPVL